MKDKIDITFDFTTDTPSYWDEFWVNNNGLGAGRNDPDAYSKKLQKYHQILWSKRLPNGEYMNLEIGSGSNYLMWKNFRFGSDSITASFRYERYRYMIEQLYKSMSDYKLFMENFIRKSYTIGGMIIFPKRLGGINQSRGCNRKISDRWDLTLECIRRYYAGEDSPLYDVLVKEKDFFDLFINFKGYVDYFLLQDCVNDDYSSVNIWIGDGSFDKCPLPKTVEEYMEWIDKQLDFVERRNKRIEKENDNNQLEHFMGA